MRKYKDFRALLQARTAAAATASVVALAEGNQLYIYDFIDSYGVNASAVVAQLQAMSGDITVRINSPGGDVQEAIAIANALERYKSKGKVSIAIDGMAASAATLIACAGDSVTIAPNAVYMIHLPETCTFGNAADHASAVDVLTMMFNQVMLPAYTAKSGLNAPDVAKLCAEETWYDAKQAVDAGFADTVGNLPDAEDTSVQAQARQRVVAEFSKALQAVTAPVTATVPVKPVLRAPLRLSNP